MNEKKKKKRKKNKQPHTRETHQGFTWFYL